MFQFGTAGRILCESGLAGRLGPILRGLGLERVLVVTDPGVVRAGLLEAPLAGLHESGIAATVFADIAPDPTEAMALAATAAVGQASAQGVVGIGGGSPMDVAKVAALLAGSGEAVGSVYGVDAARGPRLPLVLLPTTAGTGSEVTPIAILTTGTDEKKGIVTPLLLPDRAVLDPDLTLSVPPATTAATGIDAMVHAIEAFTSRHRRNPASNALAKTALELLWPALPRAWADGADRQARTDCLLGACLAGMAFANAPVAAVHALAYPIGARFHVAHGVSNALMLAPTMRFNLPAAGAHYAELAASVLGPGATAAAFIAALEDLADRLRLPRRLTEVGIAAADLDRLADDAMKQTRLLVNNPRDLVHADALALYREAL